MTEANGVELMLKERLESVNESLAKLRAERDGLAKRIRDLVREQEILWRTIGGYERAVRSVDKGKEKGSAHGAEADASG